MEPEQGGQQSVCLPSLRRGTRTYLEREAEREKIEWILRIDQSYFHGSGSGDT